MSGHACLVFQAATFLAFYLQARLKTVTKSSIGKWYFKTFWLLIQERKKIKKDHYILCICRYFNYLLILLNFETCQVFKKAYFLFPIPPAVPCMQLACYASAFWVALTRVKDHMHHPGDVIAGALIGTLLQVSN